MRRRWIILGALSAAIAVLTGAFAAHGLRGRLDPSGLAIWETASRYQMFHALALVAVGIASQWLRGRILNAAGVCFVLGSLLFCGSLYALVLTGVRGLGAITPLGGVAFIAGWLCLAWAAIRSR
jgi:uncharacterized membrane protein YgdD (TMEM256/DUF423 family)